MHGATAIGSPSPRQSMGHRTRPASARVRRAKLLEASSVQITSSSRARPQSARERAHSTRPSRQQGAYDLDLVGQNKQHQLAHIGYRTGHAAAVRAYAPGSAAALAPSLRRKHGSGSGRITGAPRSHRDREEQKSSRPADAGPGGPFSRSRRPWMPSAASAAAVSEPQGFARRAGGTLAVRLKKQVQSLRARLEQAETELYAAKTRIGSGAVGSGSGQEEALAEGASHEGAVRRLRAAQASFEEGLRRMAGQRDDALEEAQEWRRRAEEEAMEAARAREEAEGARARARAAAAAATAAYDGRRRAEELLARVVAPGSSLRVGDVVLVRVGGRGAAGGGDGVEEGQGSMPVGWVRGRVVEVRSVSLEESSASARGVYGERAGGDEDEAAAHAHVQVDVQVQAGMGEEVNGQRQGEEDGGGRVSDSEPEQEVLRGLDPSSVVLVLDRGTGGSSPPQGSLARPLLGEALRAASLGADRAGWVVVGRLAVPASEQDEYHEHELASREHARVEVSDESARAAETAWVARVLEQRCKQLAADNVRLRAALEASRGAKEAAGESERRESVDSVER